MLVAVEDLAMIDASCQTCYVCHKLFAPLAHVQFPTPRAFTSYSRHATWMILLSRNCTGFMARYISAYVKNSACCKTMFFIEEVEVTLSVGIW